MTLGEHAEAWWVEQGNTVPDIGNDYDGLHTSTCSPEYQAMYEKWVEFAFRDLRKGSK